MATPFISLVSSADSPEFNHFIATLNQTTIIALDAEWKSSSRCRESSSEWNSASHCVESDAEWKSSSHCGESDAEWKPSSYPYVTLLQLACQIGVGPCSETLVFLLDLLSIQLNSIWGPLKGIFTSSGVLKLGFGFKQDLVYLHHTFSSNGCHLGFDMVEPYIDIKNLSPFLSPDQNGNGPKSLAAICKQVLNITLSKELQLSDWSCRPLTEEQINYAAMDAYCLLRIFHVFQAEHAPKDEELDQTLHKQIDSVNDEKAIRDPNPTSLMEIVSIYGDKIVLKASDITPKLSKRKKAKKPSSKPVLPDELSECITTSWEGDDSPKFLCDVMVHGLAKHLRCVGIDAALPTSKRPEARELIEKASKEKRVLLTRDGKLLKYQYLVNSPIYKVQTLLKNEQLLEVIKMFKLEIREDQLMSRCAKCNGKFIQKPLTTEEAVEAAKGFQRIPSCLFNKNLEFWQCMDCKQLYWEGTQYHNAVQKFIDVCKLNE